MSNTVVGAQKAETAAVTCGTYGCLSGLNAGVPMVNVMVTRQLENAAWPSAAWGAKGCIASMADSSSTVPARPLGLAGSGPAFDSTLLCLRLLLFQSAPFQELVEAVPCGKQESAKAWQIAVWMCLLCNYRRQFAWAFNTCTFGLCIPSNCLQHQLSPSSEVCCVWQLL